ncbi:MAG: collagen-binding domain-containing protein [Kofleriaceae bacterium]
MLVRQQKQLGKASERGGALVAMVLVSAVLATVSVSVLTVSLSGKRERTGAHEDIHARYVCQAGLSAAVFDVQRGASGILGSTTEPIEWEGSKYHVQRADLAGDLIQLTATGVDDRAGARMELVMREVPSASYRYGAFGREYFHLESNAHVDSYNSQDGTYASQAVNGSGTNMYARMDGDIGSNGPITIEQNAKVWGDAPAGPGQTTTVMGNATCTGSTAPASTSQVIPTITVPSLTSLGNLTVSSNSTLPSGSRRYGNLTINNNRTWTITGPATIVCTNFTLNSNSNVIINPTGGPVTFYVLEDFVMRQNAVMRSTTYSPHDLAVNLLSDNVFNPETNVTVDEVDLMSNTKLYGTILAPDARIQINSNFELFGSLVARSVDLRSNSFLHFDESLNVMSESATPTWEILSWRTMPYSHTQEMAASSGSEHTGGTTGGTSGGNYPN